MMNLCEFRQRKTLGAPSRTLVGARWNFRPEAMDDIRPTQTRLLFLSAARDYGTFSMRLTNVLTENLTMT